MRFVINATLTASHYNTPHSLTLLNLVHRSSPHALILNSNFDEFCFTKRHLEYVFSNRSYRVYLL